MESGAFDTQYRLNQYLAQDGGRVTKSELKRYPIPELQLFATEKQLVVAGSGAKGKLLKQDYIDAIYSSVSCKLSRFCISS